MKFEAPVNSNYAATVVALKDFTKLPGLDRLKGAILFGNQVLVAVDSQAGALGLFFGPECRLSHEFLSENNLYRKGEWGNKSPTETGFFEEKGRVKVLKMKGNKSEGFWIPISCLSYIKDISPLDLTPGLTFDKIGNHEICKKYIPPSSGKVSTNQQKGKQPKLEDSIVEGQFRFHFDTDTLRKNAHKINLLDNISITDKWHGTSVVIGNLLVKKVLPWHHKVLKWLGADINEHTYGLTYSSRRVIKAVNGQTKWANHYYTEDIWGIVAKEVEDKIPQGYTLYGEIVGYTPDGSAIQGGYSYGCRSGEHKFVVYRVTNTNASGHTLELTWPQVQQFCTKYGLDIVPTLYIGTPEYLYPMIAPGEHWHKEFLTKLEAEFVKDGMCPYNENKVPAEGIVLRVEGLNECTNYKLKNFKFLQMESVNNDNEILDLETQESII